MTDPHAPPNRLKLATVSLRIGTALYVLIGLGALLVAAFVDLPATTPADRWIFLGTIAFLAVLSFGIAAASEAIVWGLHRRRMWAWVAGICVFGLYLPSLFFPLGALGLWGLLDTGSRALFGMGPAGATPSVPGTGGAARSSRGPGCIIAAVAGAVLLVFAVPILGIVAAIVIPNFIDAQARAKQARTLGDLRAISTAIESTRASTGELPANDSIENVIGAIRDHAGSDLPAADAWGHALRYTCWSDDGSTGCTSYALVSAGRDGIFENEDSRGYLEAPPPRPAGATAYDADLALIDGLVVRDRFGPGG